MSKSKSNKNFIEGARLASELPSRKSFLESHKIDQSSFKKTGLKWSDLEDIFQDYVGKQGKLEVPARSVVDKLFSPEARQIGVHSVRFRVKDPQSLIEKIIRKKIEDNSRDINSGNYMNEITDLIGIRALHVFKSDIMLIQNYITTNFDLKEGEKPIHYHREGDDPEFVDWCKDSLECIQQPHRKGYRSFHYIIVAGTTPKYFAEIQVRTVFEEGWSEIDHRISYHFKGRSTPFSKEIRALNGIAGSADEIGTIIRMLQEKEQAQNSPSTTPEKKRRKK